MTTGESFPSNNAETNSPENPADNGWSNFPPFQGEKPMEPQEQQGDLSRSTEPIDEDHEPTIRSVYHDGTSMEDIQIRSGLLTHLQVDLRDSIYDVYDKLDYLAKQKKRAFAIFNGQRIDNWTEDENGKSILLENQKEHEKNKREAFRNLDENLDITNVDKFNIAGVFTGVKTASEFSFYEEKGVPNNSSQDIEAILNGLDLVFEKNIESDDEHPEYNYVQYIIGHNVDSIRKVKELIKKSHQAGQTGEYATMELGHMFGFPDTAIRYFVERGRQGISDNRSKINSFGYVHDPAHYQREFAQYEKPILDMFRKYCPESAADLMINI